MCAQEEERRLTIQAEHFLLLWLRVLVIILVSIGLLSFPQFNKMKHSMVRNSNNLTALTLVLYMIQNTSQALVSKHNASTPSWMQFGGKISTAASVEEPSSWGNRIQRWAWQAWGKAHGSHAFFEGNVLDLFQARWAEKLETVLALTESNRVNHSRAVVPSKQLLIPGSLIDIRLIADRKSLKED